MTRREWLLVAGLVALFALNAWQSSRLEDSLNRIGRQLDAQEQARIDMIEARVIALEKTQARLRAKIEED